MNNDLKSLNDLGFSEHNLEQMRTILDKPHGTTIVTSPTASGKTTILHAMLREFTEQDKRSILIEDAGELQVEGIFRQFEKPESLKKYTEQINDLVRMRPEVVAIGEIRHEQALQSTHFIGDTGHISIASLHGADTVNAILRLQTMDSLGLMFSLSNKSINAFIAQQLRNKLCEKCKVEHVLTNEEKATLQGDNKETIVSTVYTVNPLGCEQCNHGHNDYIAIQEILILNEEIRELLASKPLSSQIQEAAVSNGMIPLEKDELDKALAGNIDIKTVLSKV